MEKSEKKQPMIRIRGANENNLKSVDLDIPRNQFIVFTGLSGSGKSSLAFDRTILFPAIVEHAIAPSGTIISIFKNLKYTV